MAVELFPHNQTTYEKMEQLFEEKNRVGVVQPTGTGKSFIFLKWIEDHQKDSFILMAPSTEIFTQLQEYAEASDIPEALRKLQMISYQALLLMSEDELRAIHADKIIIDEFHRTGAELWGAAVLEVLGANPDAKVLGASATPVRYLDNARDMGLELFDRNLAVEMTLGEAVQRKILPKPIYVPVWYDNGYLAEYKKDISGIKDDKQRKDLEETLYRLQRQLENAYGAEDVFAKYMPHDHGKYIVFCRNKEHLDEMINILPKWLSKVNSNIHFYVSIKTQNDKTEQLSEFKADQSGDAIKLLLTIDRLNEGLHVKGIDGVIMLRPTTSPIIYLQQMGRALSSGAKEHQPLIFDMVNNYHNVQMSFKGEGYVNVFEKEFRDAIPKTRDSESFRIFEDMVSFNSILDEINEVLYPDNDTKWDETCDVFEEFIKIHNRNPKRNEIYKGVKLGAWLNTQFYFRKKGELRVDREERLEKIGAFDSYKPREETNEGRWNAMCDILEEFIKIHGREPKQKETYKGVNLGKWVKTQQYLWKKGELRADRQKRLEKLSVFDSYTPRETDNDTRWDATCDVFEEFIKIHGREPKQKETYKGVNLGNWWRTQKYLWKERELREDREERLEKLGVFELCWSIKTANARWDATCDVFEEFTKIHGRKPKDKEIYKGVNLGNWWNMQKYFRKKGKLRADREERLEKLGAFDLYTPIETDNDERWEYNKDLLEEFIKIHNRNPKRNEIYKGVKLGAWVTNQKQRKNEGKLRADREERLEKIGVFDSYKPRKETNDARWEYNKDLFEEFIKIHGRNPKQKEIYKGVKLGVWLNEQKQLRRKGKLREDRLKKLQALGVLEVDSDSKED